MPRIYDSVSDPHDFCRSCFPNESNALEMFGNLGDGPDGRGNCYSYDDDHPPFEDTDYECEQCGKPLRAADNSPSFYFV